MAAKWRLSSIRGINSDKAISLKLHHHGSQLVSTRRRLILHLRNNLLLLLNFGLLLVVHFFELVMLLGHLDLQRVQLLFDQVSDFGYIIIQLPILQLQLVHRVLAQGDTTRSHPLLLNSTGICWLGLQIVIIFLSRGLF